MATQPTNLPVPSESPRDLKFNAGKIDEFVTSLSEKYLDRFGFEHYTLEGLKKLVLQQIYNLGWNVVGTFQSGTTINSGGDIVQDEATGLWYRWDDLATIPKDVPIGSTPDTTGGVGKGKWVAVDVSDVLRRDLEKENGATNVGGSLYIVDAFEDALNARPFNSKGLATRFHHVTGIGSAMYFPDGTTGTASTGNELKFFDASGKGWYLRHDGKIDCQQFGVVADGTDETDKLQLWLDCCAQAGAEAYIPENISPSAAGLICTSQHDGMKFRWEGYVKHWGDGTKSALVVDSWDPPSGYVLYLKEVSGISGEIRINGDRTTKIADEHVHNIHSYGGENHILSLYFKDTRGDGIYLNGSQGNLESSPPKNMHYKIIESINSDYDGRNAISIICVNNCIIESLVSIKHGGMINGRVMPGGFDIEPNYFYQKCNSVTLNSAMVDSGGSHAIGVYGKENPELVNDYCVKDVVINNAIATCTNSGYNSAGVFRVSGANGIYFNGIVKTTENYALDYVGVHVVGVTGCMVKAEVSKCKYSSYIGFTSVLGLYRTINSRFDILSDTFHSAVSIGDVDGVEVNLMCIRPSNMGSGDMGLVQFAKNGTTDTSVRRTHVSVRLSGTGGAVNSLVYGVRVNPSLTPSIFPDSVTISGDIGTMPHNTSNNNHRLYNTATIRKENLLGVSPYSGVPISGTNIWGVGDAVMDLSPVAGGYSGRVYTSSGFKRFGVIEA